MTKSRKIIFGIALALVIVLVVAAAGWAILRLCGYSIYVTEETWRDQPAKVLHIIKKGTAHDFVYVNGILKEEAMADVNTMTVYHIAYDGQEIAPTTSEGSKAGGKTFMKTSYHAPIPKLPLFRPAPYK